MKCFQIFLFHFSTFRSAKLELVENSLPGEILATQKRKVAGFARYFFAEGISNKLSDVGVVHKEDDYDQDISADAALGSSPC